MAVSSIVGWTYFIYFVLTLGGMLGFGFGTRAIATNKGFSANWFWFGFFCGPVGLIVAACITPNKSNYVSYTNDNGYSLLSNNAGTWRCSCGRINQDYTGTCVCGREKASTIYYQPVYNSAPSSVPQTPLERADVATAEEETRKKEEKMLRTNNGWVCMRCKKVIPSNLGFCSCGMSRGESKKIYEQLYGNKADEENAKTEDASKTTEETSAQPASMDKFEEIMKYKELLDQGIISQEEFDAKKKELL